MFAFRYQAKKGPYGSIESIVYATTKESAFKKVSALGYHDIEIGEPMSPASPQEKRIFIRVDRSIELKYKLFKGKITDQENSEFEAEFSTFTANISAGGLLIKTEEYLIPGSVLELSLSLPEQEAIKGLARVVRVEEIKPDIEYDVAVYFLDLSDAERSRLNRYLLQEF